MLSKFMPVPSLDKGGGWGSKDMPSVKRRQNSNAKVHQKYSTPSPVALWHYTGERACTGLLLASSGDKLATCSKELKLRVGTVNVGTMSKRYRETVDLVKRRELDFCCLQETKWKGGSARNIEGYKFFWQGCESGLAGVGVLVAERWVD